MPLKKSVGNMYDWVTHTHSHLGGECPHKCSYCYVQKNRFGVSPRYQGHVRLIEDEFKVNYGSGKTIFIEHMNDLFAQRDNDEVMDEQISKVLIHCEEYPDNKYVFQTKNPLVALAYLTAHHINNYMIGTTIESNRHYPQMGNAPSIELRRGGMMAFGKIETFVTIEPIMDFDVSHLVAILKDINPLFVNIGADSKGCHLPEPTPAKVKEFVAKLQEAGIVIRKKNNLGRMLA